MDDQKPVSKPEPRKSDVEPMLDMIEEPPHVALDPEEFEERAKVELHKRIARQERVHHVDLSKEEYTPDEVASLIGTSREVVLHAVWSGDLKAERAGHDVVCIKHEDVTKWLRRRAM
jgi:excisionase family DNA binding protein